MSAGSQRRRLAVQVPGESAAEGVGQLRASSRSQGRLGRGLLTTVWIQVTWVSTRAVVSVAALGQPGPVLSVAARLGSDPGVILM